MVESAETRWRMGIMRKWDTPGLQGQAPGPSLWCAILNAKPYLPPVGQTKKLTLAAHVNHGRWMVDCPFCGSSQHAAVTDPWFYCGVCCNQPARQTLPVVFPKNAEQLVAVLEARPLPRFRNWHPGEAIKDLQAQDEDAIARGLHEAVA